MRVHAHRRPRWLLATVGLVLGSVAGAGVAWLATPAVAQHPSATAGVVLDATHLPPLLTLPGETVELAYDVHCSSGESTVGEEGCLAHGTVFARPVGAGQFAEIPLGERSTNGIRQLAVAAPAGLASRRHGFEYYAVIEAPELGRRVVVPAGGAEAPHVSRPLESAVEVGLGRHRFGRITPATERVASARWGSGGADVGLEGGRGSSPVGASAFDVAASGAILLLDQAHRRILRWNRRDRTPESIPLSVHGTIADLAAGSDGSVYVLESVAEHGRNPLVRRFDETGRELEATETAERGASQIRPSLHGPLVLSQPSHLWMPVELAGVPASRADQLRHGRAGRTARGGSEVVILRRGSELLAGVVSGGVVTRSWRVMSETALGEVQLAELAGQRLVVVLRTYDESAAEFIVLVLGRSGVERQLALATLDWAETAPLGRFRLAGRDLYRLGSSPAGAFVDRFDLEVR